MILCNMNENNVFIFLFIKIEIKYYIIKLFI